MKTTKLVIGILMIVLAFIIAIQSMIAGMGNAMSNNGETSGSLGFLIAIFYLVAGIVYIVTKKATKLTADIVNAVILCLGWLIAIAGAGSYADLNVWGWLGLIIGLGFLTWHYMQNKKLNKE